MTYYLILASPFLTKKGKNSIPYILYKVIKEIVLLKYFINKKSNKIPVFINVTS